VIDPTPYVTAWKEDAQARRAAERLRAAEIRSLLPRVAAVLRDEFGARRVGYFGSLAGGRFRPDSDVDLFVDRIRRGAWIAAVDRTSELLGRAVDLVECEKAPAALLATLRRDGVLVDA